MTKKNASFYFDKLGQYRKATFEFSSQQKNTAIFFKRVNPVSIRFNTKKTFVKTNIRTVVF